MIPYDIDPLFHLILRKRNQDKFEKPNERALRFIFNDKSFAYDKLSYDPYGPASAFFAKPLMKVPYEGSTHLRERGPGKSRTVLLQKRTASRVKTSSKFVCKLVI